MKTAALEKAVNRPVGLALTREETKIRVMQSSRLAGIEDRLLDPGAMSLLQVERQRPVEAPEVFQNRKMWQGLQDYHLRMKRCEREGVLTARVEQINAKIGRAHV